MILSNPGKPLAIRWGTISDFEISRTHGFIPKIEFQEPSIESESPTAPQRLEELDQPVSVPPSTTAPSRSLSRFHSRDTTPTVDISAPEYNTQKLKQTTSAYSERREISILEGYEKSPALSSLSHSRPTSIDVTQESSALSTVRIEQTPGPPGGVYPSPPPVYDPLGPAAQAPFLPAISEYEGSDIYYSCRPGGPKCIWPSGYAPYGTFWRVGMGYLGKRRGDFWKWWDQGRIQGHACLVVEMDCVESVRISRYLTLIYWYGN